jgi:hypothetical protein
VHELKEMADHTQVWVADAHQGWALATVLAKNGNKYNIRLDSGEVNMRWIDAIIYFPNPTAT